MPGRRQEHPLREVDSLQRLLGRACQLGEDVEVVDRQPVQRQQLGVELPRDGRVSAQEVDPRLELYASQISYLTTQASSCIFIDCSTIEHTNTSI